MIKRIAEVKLIKLAATFKVVAVIGPRQSGKTTLVKTLFKSKPYVSLENPDIRNFALTDPRGFLQAYPKGAIFDEIQRAPELFSYLQEIIDNSKQKGLFILTGSNNFLLQESITQSLAGRVGYLNLLPFSINELEGKRKKIIKDDKLMLEGFYPPVHNQKIPISLWAPNYIKTYIERDVRQIKNVSSLIVFEKFMRLLAGRCAQELNMSALSIEAGVDVKTIQSWIGILESSFIIYLLKPHYKNFNKTIVKRPKVYFYDTSIICSLLSVVNTKQLQNYPIRGAIFENMVVIELIKYYNNISSNAKLYFWRDKTGHEIDIIIENAQKLIPVEIKSGKTIHSEFFKNIDYWCNLSAVKTSYIIYAGSEKQLRSNNTHILPLRDFINIK